MSTPPSQARAHTCAGRSVCTVPAPRRLAASLAAVLVSVAAPSAQAADPVVVTASREPLALQRLAADLAGIEPDRVQGSSADSLADLLRREAGVQLSRNGGPGHATGLSIRGAPATQVVVLVDGMRVGSATLGSTALESLPLAQVDRVEVLRGPGSSLYGADAVGGVVQVFTKAGEPGWQFEGRAAAGGYGSREASVGLRGAEGAWDWAATLSHEASDGISTLRPGDQFGNHHPDRDGHRLDAAQLRLGFAPARGHRLGASWLRTRLDSRYDGSEFLPPAFAQDNTPDFRTRQASEVATLDWRGPLGPSLSGSVRAARSVDDTRDGGTVTDRFRTERRLLAAQLAWKAGAAGQFVGALERQEDRGRSTSYTAPVQRRNAAAVLEWTGSVGRFAWQADARRDDASDHEAVSTGRLGGSVQLAPGLRLRALAGSTFRAPSFNDLYFPGYGVPTLRAERGRSTELGLDWRHAVGEAALTLWRNRVRDLIGYQPDAGQCPPDPAYAFGCAGNTARARLHGATLSARQRVASAWTLRGQLDFLEARDEATGQRLPRRAAHQASAEAAWTQGVWSASAALLRVGARPDAGKRLAAETTLDLQAGWRFARGWQLQGRLLNATDRDLEPARDYQGLGRQAWLVLRHDASW